MKKLVSIFIALAIIFVWLHWGGLSNDFGTFIIALIAIFACSVAKGKHA
jgi:hypothetical protein